MKFYLIILVLFSCQSNIDNLKIKERTARIQYNASFSKNSNNIFQDETSRYGLGDVIAENHFLIDLNFDNQNDLVILPESFSQPVFYYYNSSNSQFQKGESPFKKPVKASYLLFYDFNSDEILDVLVGVNNQKLALEPYKLKIYYGSYENKKLVFSKSQNVFEKTLSSISTIVLDFDRDGDLDLFIANWFDFSEKQAVASHDILLENDKGVFKDVTDKLVGENRFIGKRRIHPNATPTISASICDINSDGFIDIVTSSTHQRENKLWLNNARSTFSNKAQESGYAFDKEGMNLAKSGGRTFFSSCYDYDEDTITDIFSGELSHNYDSDNVDRTSILKGRRVGFVPLFWRTEKLNDVRSVHWHQSDKRALWADFNHDSRVDLFVENTGFPPHTRGELYLQKLNSIFTDHSKTSGLDIVNPWQSLILDVNQDKSPDILTLQSDRRDASIKRRMYLFTNKVKPTKSLVIELVGNIGNRFSIGSQLFVRYKRFSEVKTKSHLVQRSFGTLAPMQAGEVFMSFKEEDTILEFSVIWSSGKNQKMKVKVPKGIFKRKHFLCQKTNMLVTNKELCY
jgi:hypothetical protein